MELPSGTLGSPSPPASYTVDLQEKLSAEMNASRRLDIIDQALRPPEPQLLDTCVLQNLDWIDRKFGPSNSVVWDDAAESESVRSYGVELTEDLIALSYLYRRFENKSGYPWLVCNSAVEEAGILRGNKGKQLMQLIDHLSGIQDDWCNETYPGIAQGLLLSRKPARVSPLILRALGVKVVEQVYEAEGPLGFLPDRGDRLVVAHAIFSNIPAVLTTDRKSFWVHRNRLYDFGLQIMRPVELLEYYEPYWEALEDEYTRRQRIEIK